MANFSGFRRHPTALELGAFFDGEDLAASSPWAGGEAAAHVAACQRCQAHIHDLRRVRAVLRGQPVPAPVAARPAVLRPMLAPLALGLAGLLFGLAVGPLRTPLNVVVQETVGGGEKEAAPAPPGSPRPSTVPSPVTTVDRSDHHSPAPSTTVAPARSASPAPTTPAGPHSFRIGVAVPTSGPLAGEGADVVRAVRKVADGANATGGVAGRHVDVVVAKTEDQGGLAALPSQVDVIVGGFGFTAPDKTPWLLPADPGPSGAEVVSAELTPRLVGSRLASDLVERGVKGDVGAVIGDGSDAALADGIGSVVSTVTVPSKSDTDCVQEVTALQGRQVAALAVAGGPDLAAKCMQAANKLNWHPTGGVLLSPSAAYAHVDRVDGADGARTVLGLPWPTADRPGAARFRSAVPNSMSYRALVSFAGAELAVLAAQQHGTVSAATVSTGTWKTDLIDFAGGVNRGAQVVAAGKSGWAPPPKS